MFLVRSPGTLMFGIDSRRDLALSLLCLTAHNPPVTIDSGRHSP